MMNPIKKIFSRKEYKMVERTNEFIMRAKMMTTASFTTFYETHKKYGDELCDRYQKDANKEYEFYLIIACLSHLVFEELHNANKTNADEVIELMTKGLNNYNNLAKTGLTDCINFIVNGSEKEKPEYTFIIVPGMWVFWNLFDRRPDGEDEFNVVLTFGNMARHYYNFSS